jgi:hypothetical protein
VELVPRTDRDLVLARLATAVSDLQQPLPVATTAPATGEVLRVAGYGRTSTEWVPDRLATALFAVQTVTATTAGIAGSTSAKADTCKGDAGGPAFREGAGRVELLGIHSTSWQHGCLGVTDTRQGSTETRVDDLAGWIKQVTNPVSNSSLFGNRIAVLQNGRVLLKEGDLYAGWTVQWTDSVVKLQIDGKRVGVLTQDGLLHVKDDNEPGAPWTIQEGSVTDFSLSGNRILINKSGAAVMKEGNLYAGWTVQWTDSVVKLQIDGKRVGVLTRDGLLHVKDDNEPGAPWGTQMGSVTDFRLSGNRIGVLKYGRLWVKEGNLYDRWVIEA